MGSSKLIRSYQYLKCKSNTKVTEILRILNNGLIHSKILNCSFANNQLLISWQPAVCNIYKHHKFTFEFEKVWSLN
jgi:hypothetical protein